MRIRGAIRSTRSDFDVEMDSAAFVIELDPVAYRDAIGTRDAHSEASALAAVEYDNRKLVGRFVDELFRGRMDHGFGIDDSHLSGASEDCDNRGGAAAAKVLREADVVPGHLAITGLAAQLHYQVANLAHAGCSHGMSFCLQSA